MYNVHGGHVGRGAYLVHGGHVGAPLVAALDPDAGRPTISPGVQAAHTTKHLVVNSLEKVKPAMYCNGAKIGLKWAKRHLREAIITCHSGQPPVHSLLSELTKTNLLRMTATEGHDDDDDDDGDDGC